MLRPGVVLAVSGHRGAGCDLSRAARASWRNEAHGFISLGMKATWCAPRPQLRRQLTGRNLRLSLRRQGICETSCSLWGRNGISRRLDSDRPAARCRDLRELAGLAVYRPRLVAHDSALTHDTWGLSISGLEQPHPASVRHPDPPTMFENSARCAEAPVGSSPR